MASLHNKKELDAFVQELQTLSAPEREALLTDIEKVSSRYLHIWNFKGNVVKDELFQRTFNAFYQVRRNAEWRAHFYDMFERMRNEQRTPSFQEIITELYDRTGQWEYSFSTKLLHTLNVREPIVDSRVLNLICLPYPKGRTVESFGEHYQQVRDSIGYLKRNLTEFLDDFDRSLPALKSMPVMKKIDLILWRYRRKNKSR